MIKRTTYNTVPGLNYIQDPELAFATIYIVEKDGVQHDEYLPGMLVNRTFLPTPSDGKITFPQVFDPGTTVLVVYKPISGSEPVTPPGVCVPVAITPITLPDMVVGVPYSQLIEFTGTEPFVISGATLPAGISITNSGNTALLSGTPTTSGLALVEFDVSNCSGSVASFNQAVNVFPATVNFYVSNTSMYGVSISIVDGISYSLATGAFPITYLTGITGYHGDYTGIIRMYIAGLVFPQTLTLEKNGVILETLFPAIDANYIFASQAYLAADEIVIRLN